MLLVVGAIVLGILVGLGLGGSLRILSEVRFRWWPLALVGLALQFVPVPSLEGRLDHWLAVGLLIASYGVLLAFVAANIRLPGFPLIAVGFALNALVISVNGGMPVSVHALREAYGSGYRDSLHKLVTSGGAKHHLAGPGDVLRPLSDVIPVGSPVRNVFSPGDMVSFLGVAWVLAAATRGPGGKHRVRASRRLAAGADSAVRPGRDDGPSGTTPGPWALPRRVSRDSTPLRPPSPRQPWAPP